MLKTILLVVFSVAQAALGPNLVVNPSFEKGLDGNNPLGWTKWSDGNTSGMFTWDNYGGRTFGKQVSIYAMKIDNMSSRGGYVSENPIKVSDRKEYLLVGFLSGEKASGEIRFSVRFTGKEGSLGEVFSPAVSGSTGPQRGDWVVSAVRVRPPEGATMAWVVCRADYTAGSAWFDDLGFYELGGSDQTEGYFRDGAFKSLGGKPRGHSEASFAETFSSEADGVEASIKSLRSSGHFWQAAASALGEGRTLLGAGLSDVSAGWTRRGWERLAESASALSRAIELARTGGSRPDPMPGGVDRPFPLGVTIPLRQPSSGTEWAHLFREAASFGFTDATVDLPWGLWETREGEFDFKGVDAVFDAADASGLTLYPQAGPKFRMTAGRAPDGKRSLMGMPSWFMEKYPDSALCGAKGECISGVDGLFWELAFVNPALLKAEPAWMKAWDNSLTALGAHAKGRRSLGGWFIGDEPLLGQGPDQIRNITKPGLLGYNAPYREAFGNWLKVRYGGKIENLAKAWGSKAPSSFSKAKAPDDQAILTAQSDPAKRYKGPSQWIGDWLAFRGSALAGGLDWAGDRLSSASGGVPSVSKLAPFNPVGPLDPEGMAADIFGSEFNGKPMAVDMTTDAIPFPLLTRAQDVGIGAVIGGRNGSPLWLTDYCFRRGELLGGENRADLLAVPYVASYVLSAVASGARGFFFRSWTARPGVGSFAFPAREGKPGVALADEGLAVARTARLLKVLAPWLNGATAGSPRYAVVFSWATVLNDDPQAHHLLAFMNALALGGIHDVVLVSEESLGKDGKVPYDVLFAPYATRMGKRGVDALKTFVKRGGTLVADTYIASVKANGSRGKVLPWELDSVFGLSAESDERPTDAGNIGVMPQPAFKEWKGVISFSLSMFSGGYKLRAAKNAEVLSRYLGGKKGREYPAITVHRYGKGQAVIFPRIRHWPKFLAELEGAKLTRPEYRGLSMGTQFKMFNGVVCGITLRKLLEHIGKAPQAMLVRAPVSSTFLDDQENWMLQVGIPQDELEHSKKMVRESQAGFPMISRPELLHLVRVGGIDLDEYAPIRVSLLSGKDGGKAVFVLSFSSMARDAEVTLPPCSSVVDLVTGEEFTVAEGRARMPLAPYQSRVLALFQ